MIRVAFPPSEQHVRMLVQLRQGAGLAEERRGVSLQALIDSIAKGETVLALADGGYLLGRMTPLVTGLWGFAVDEVRVLPQYDTPQWWQEAVEWLIEFCHYAGAVQVLASAWDTETAALYRDKLHLQSQIVIMVASPEALRAGLVKPAAPETRTEEAAPLATEVPADGEIRIKSIAGTPSRIDFEDAGGSDQGPIQPIILQPARQAMAEAHSAKVQPMTVQPRLRGVKILGKGA